MALVFPRFFQVKNTFLTTVNMAPAIAAQGIGKILFHRLGN